MPSTLQPDVGPRDHVEGPMDAELTLVEYGDYQCPYCGEAAQVVKALQEELGPRLRFVFRNFPLRELHAHAEAAAEAAEAAGTQGKFWEMHDLLFEHQRQLGMTALTHYAEQLGLDADRFAHALRGREFAPRVEDDFESGMQSGVQGTPTFFINGVRHEGALDFESLLEALESVSNSA